MEVDDADYFLGVVYDYDRGDLFLFHRVERFAGQDVRADGLWIARHGGACG